MTKYVIEMASVYHVQELAKDLDAFGWPSLARQLKAQIPKPRIVEPPWGKKVRARRNGASCEGLWLHAYKAGAEWTNGDIAVHWSDLINPEVVE